MAEALRAFSRDCTNLVAAAADQVASAGRSLLGEATADTADPPGAPSLALHLPPPPPPQPQPQPRLDLQRLDPSLYGIGLEVAERIDPRYLEKAGRACERMQQAGLPVEVIQEVLLATFSGFGGTVDGEHSEHAIRHIFGIFDASGDGFLDEDEFLTILPLLGEVVPSAQSAALFAAVDTSESGTISKAEFVNFILK